MVCGTRVLQIRNDRKMYTFFNRVKTMRNQIEKSQFGKNESQPTCVRSAVPFRTNIAAVSCVQAIIEASGGINEILLCRRTQNVQEETKWNGNGLNTRYECNNCAWSRLLRRNAIYFSIILLAPVLCNLILFSSNANRRHTLSNSTMFSVAAAGNRDAAVAEHQMTNNFPRFGWKFTFSSVSGRYLW